MLILISFTLPLQKVQVESARRSSSSAPARHPAAGRVGRSTFFSLSCCYLLHVEKRALVGFVIGAAQVFDRALPVAPFEFGADEPAPELRGYIALAPDPHEGRKDEFAGSAPQLDRKSVG